MKFRLLLLVLTTPLIHSALYAAQPETLSRAASTGSHSLDLEKEVSEINFAKVSLTKKSRSHSTLCLPSCSSPVKQEKSRSESACSPWQREDYYLISATTKNKKDALERYGTLKDLINQKGRQENLEKELNQLENFLNADSEKIVLPETDLYEKSEISDKKELSSAGRGLLYHKMVRIGMLTKKTPEQIRELRSLMDKLGLKRCTSPVTPSEFTLPAKKQENGSPTLSKFSF